MKTRRDVTAIANGNNDDFAKPLGYTFYKKNKGRYYVALLRDKVFVVLPTGYSKSLCYQWLLFIFDSLRTDGLQSVILVISPLVAIIKDQVRKHPSWGNHGTHVDVVLLVADLYLHEHSIPQNTPLLTFPKL